MKSDCEGKAAQQSGEERLYAQGKDRRTRKRRKAEENEEAKEGWATGLYGVAWTDEQLPLSLGLRAER